MVINCTTLTEKKSIKTSKKNKEESFETAKSKEGTKKSIKTSKKNKEESFETAKSKEGTKKSDKNTEDSILTNSKPILSPTEPEKNTELSNSSSTEEYSDTIVLEDKALNNNNLKYFESDESTTSSTFSSHDTEKILEFFIGKSK
ncbi:hypothetical protein NUSPORA_00131 [Nucleospora cyclopteri]